MMLWYGLALICLGSTPQVLQIGPTATHKRCQDIQAFLASTCPTPPPLERYPCWSVPQGKP